MAYHFDPADIFEILVGIDPDVDKSGIAVYDLKLEKYSTIKALSMCEMFKLLGELKNEYQLKMLVLIEDARLLKCSSWHGGGRGSVRNVGMNMGACRVLCDFMTYSHINYKRLKPANFSNYFKLHALAMKITENEAVREVLGDKTLKTNAESRAAIAIIEKNKFIYR